MKDRIQIVNDKDQLIDHKERGTLLDSDIYRVSALWVTNSMGQILLAQRSFDKKNNPGKWGPAVAGTLDEGEKYYQNIVKETEEEIGVTDVNFIEKAKIFNDGEHRYFVQWYTAILDKEANDFRIQKEEVEQVKWFSKQELLANIKSHPDMFLGNLDRYAETF